MYRAGTELTIVVAGSAESFWTSLDFWNGISAPRLVSSIDVRLTGRGIDVYSIDLADRGWSDIGTWQFRATVKCASRSDHARAEDVAAVVANAFQQETGYMPTVSIISAGQPDAPPLQPPWTSGVGDVLGDVGAGLNATLQQIGTVGVVAVVLVLGVIVWSKVD